MLCHNIYLKRRYKQESFNKFAFSIILLFHNIIPDVQCLNYDQRVIFGK